MGVVLNLTGELISGPMSSSSSSCLISPGTTIECDGIIASSSSSGVKLSFLRLTFEPRRKIGGGVETLTGMVNLAVAGT